MRYLLKIDDIFHVLNKNLTTNIKIEDIRSYSGSIRKISKNNIKAFTVPGSSNYIDKLWFFVADLKSTKKIVNENFKKGI